MFRFLLFHNVLLYCSFKTYFRLSTIPEQKTAEMLGENQEKIKNKGKKKEGKKEDKIRGIPADAKTSSRHFESILKLVGTTS